MWRMEAAEERLISVSIHKTGKGAVVAACDAELLGRAFSDGELRLKLREEFYSGERMAPEKLAELLEECFTANLVGERAVKAYCANRPSAAESVMRIGDVPHLHIYSL